MNRAKLSPKSLAAFDEQVTLNRIDGRINLCPCFRGEFVSATFRLSNEKEKDDIWQPMMNFPNPPSWNYSQNNSDFKVQTSSIVQEICESIIEKNVDSLPSTSTQHSNPKAKHSSLLKGLGNLVQATIARIYPSHITSKAPPPEGQSHHSGLVIFAGSTKSGKSVIAKSFTMSAILNACEANKQQWGTNGPTTRLPHLVTFEDPIETWSIYPDGGGKAPLKSPLDAAKFGFCLTARQKGTDVSSLSAALNDALRQTPTCFYIGEVRDVTEWRDILSFAGTGHLVVATTHGSSIVEVFNKILTSCEARTAADRHEIASRILGCIHLVLQDKVVLPSLWTRARGGLSQFVESGLSSVISNNEHVLGRMHFMERLNSRGEAPTEVVERAKSIDLQQMTSQ